MKRTLAHTKEQLSAVVHAAQQEPQIITNRGREVAAIIPIADFEALQRLKQKTDAAESLPAALQALRDAWLQDEAHDGLPAEALVRLDRGNAFLLDQ